MTDESGKTEDKPSDKPNGKPKIDGWPTASTAARLLGVKPQIISNMVKSGELHPQTDADGWRRYDPAELEQYQTDAGERSQPATVIEELTAALKVTTGALTQYLKILPEQYQKLCAQQARTIRSQRRRIARLERRDIERADALAEVMSQRDQREVQKMVAERTQDRWDKCADALSKHVPDLVQDLTLGAELRKMMLRMDPEMLSALLEVAQDLDPEDRAALEKLRDRMKAKQAQKKEEYAKGAEPKRKPPTPEEPPGKDDIPIETAGTEVP